MRHRNLVTSLCRRLRDERGITLVELSVSMLVTSLLGALMVVWFSAGAGSETSHRSYDEAIADLREVSDRISREVRGAGYLTSASPASLTLWLDGNRNGAEDAGETITWTIAGATMTRSTDVVGESAVLATRLGEGSGFTFDSTDAAAVTRVTLTLTADATTRAGIDQIEQTVEIYLRNA